MNDHGLRAVMLRARLEAVDRTRTLAEVVAARAGRVYGDAEHEAVKAGIRERIAMHEALATPGEYP